MTTMMLTCMDEHHEEIDDVINKIQESIKPMTSNSFKQSQTTSPPPHLASLSENTTTSAHKSLTKAAIILTSTSACDYI
jgi:hypothetical protein